MTNTMMKVWSGLNVAVSIDATTNSADPAKMQQAMSVGTHQGSPSEAA